MTTTEFKSISGEKVADATRRAVDWLKEQPLNANPIFDGVDAKGLTASQIQIAIDDYIRSNTLRKMRWEETQRDEARKEAQRKQTAQRQSLRRLIEKGGIGIANADEYRSSQSTLDLRPDAEGFYGIYLNAGGSWSLRRPSSEQQTQIDDRKRRMIATLRKIEGIEVKAETVVKTQSWKGETEQYLTTSYRVRKIVKAGE